MHSDPNDSDWLNSLSNLAHNLGLDSTLSSQSDIDINSSADSMQSSDLAGLSRNLSEEHGSVLPDINQAGSEHSGYAHIDHLNALDQHPKWLHSEETVSTGGYSQHDTTQAYADGSMPEGYTTVESSYSYAESLTYPIQDGSNSHLQGSEHHADVLNSNVTVHHQHYWVPSLPIDWSDEYAESDSDGDGD